MNETDKQEDQSGSGMSRSHFIGTTAAAAAAFTIVPRNVLGGPGYQAPSDMVNVAGIGVGAQGGGDIQNVCDPDEPIVNPQRTSTGQPLTPEEIAAQEARMAEMMAQYAAQMGVPVEELASMMQRGGPGREPRCLANIYALCDVDEEYAAHVFAGYPRVKKYTDWRRMLDREPEIDAVVIGTPDHNHAPIAAAAIKAGKHVYVEKPMCKTVFESRELRRLAEEYDVVTQQGNQGHNQEGSFLTVEWIKAGALGEIREVHCQTNRPVGMWPQGNLERPAGVRVPRTLDWDTWLGPAPVKPYNPEICHFVWRGLWDYGTGAIGDMGAHILDAPIWALDLPLPTSIQASSTPYNDEYLPLSERIVYEFPARGNLPPVTVTWVDGGVWPDRVPQVPDGSNMQDAVYIGSNGVVMMHGSHGGTPTLYPVEVMEDFTPPEPSIPRTGDIFEDWIDAIKNGTKSANDFEIAGHLCEIMLLGVLAVAMKDSRTTLQYDGENMEFTNLPEANDLLHYEYRQGWTL